MQRKYVVSKGEECNDWILCVPKVSGGCCLIVAWVTVGLLLIDPHWFAVSENCTQIDRATAVLVGRGELRRADTVSAVGLVF